MFEYRQGSIFLFRLLRINVYLHWTWFLVAFVYVQNLSSLFVGPNRSWWALLTYCGFFAIVLMHEYGHALACRSVKGTAKQIMLWPLGGVAYVAPPPRPWPVLWSLVAGPLVNVLLIPVFALLITLFVGWDFEQTLNSPQMTIVMLAGINLTLLVFNLLPIYPLDGGQIVQAVLWMKMGRARSLRVVSIFGMVLGTLLGLVSLVGLNLSIWFLVLAIYIVMQAYRGYKIAGLMMQQSADYAPWLDRR